MTQLIVNYILECPISSREARRRGLPRDTSKLIISFREEERREGDKAIALFSKLLTKLQSHRQKVYAQPVGSYVHLDKYGPELEALGVPYCFDREYQEGMRKKPLLLTVECDSEAKIAAVFRIFKADAIVFFLATEYRSGNQLERNLLKARFGHGYEEYYLKEMERYGLFAFFEDTRLSLEILGRRGEIIGALSTSLVVEKEFVV